ncbi:MAG: DUF2807 domain-containing protein [Flavobacterium sp.]|nr:MAG: DUF2807 domain-containing protein [Flavobacterium sp.]
MKSLVHYTLAITLTLLSINTGFAQFKKVKGNGNITTKTITTEDYSEIEVVGFMDVTLVTGTEGTITVSTDSNIHEYVEITSNKGVLKLKIKNNVTISTKKGVNITVPFTAINNLSLTGSGDVETKNTINTTHFETELTGSGDMKLDVKATSIDAKLTGSGDLILTGNVSDLEIKVTGSGDFVGKNLNAENVEAYVSGSGDISVNATKKLKARVHGSGDITYSGNPAATDKKVMGSGDITSH